MKPLNILIKRVSIPAALILAALCLAACAKAAAVSPKEVVEKALADYKARDYAAFNAVLSESVKDFSPDDSDKSAAILSAFANIEYTVGDESVNGSKAAVTAEISAVDLNKVISQFITWQLQEQMDGRLNTDDRDELDDIINSMFDAMIQNPDNERRAATVEVQLRRKGASWEIVPTDDLKNALTCFQNDGGVKS